MFMGVPLPGMDSCTVRQRLKADRHTQHIPIVAMSALAMQGDRERLLEQGFDGYISKPMAMKDVPQLVACYLPAAGEP